MSIELWTWSPPPVCLRLKGVSKKLRDRTLYHWHYSWSNASYLETEMLLRIGEEAGPVHRWRSVRQSFDPHDRRIRSCDLYNLSTPVLIYCSRFKAGLALIRAANILPMSPRHKLVLGIEADLLRKDFLANWMNEMLSHQFAPQLSVPSVSKHWILPLANFPVLCPRCLRLIFEYKFIIAGSETLRGKLQEPGARTGS